MLYLYDGLLSSYEKLYRERVFVDNVNNMYIVNSSYFWVVLLFC